MHMDDLNDNRTEPVIEALRKRAAELEEELIDAAMENVRMSVELAVLNADEEADTEKVIAEAAEEATARVKARLRHAMLGDAQADIDKAKAESLRLTVRSNLLRMRSGLR